MTNIRKMTGCRYPIIQSCVILEQTGFFQKIREKGQNNGKIQFFDYTYALLGPQGVRELTKSPLQNFIKNTLTMLTMVGVAALIGSSSRVSAHCHKLANFLPFLQHILTILPAVET